MAQWSFQLGRAMGPWEDQQRDQGFFLVRGLPLWCNSCRMRAIRDEKGICRKQSVAFAKGLQEGRLLVVARLGRS